MKMMQAFLLVAMVAGAGLFQGRSVHAAPVLGLQLKDVGSNTADGPNNYSPSPDGVAGAFINYTELDILTFSGAGVFTGDVGTGTILGEGAENPLYSFSTGTIYGSSFLEPFTFGGGMVADISNGVLTFSSLDFGVNIVPGTVWMPPDPGSLTVNWVVPTGPNTYDVSFMWSRTFVWDPLDSGMQDAPYHLYLEGTMTTSAVPVPGAAWLLLSGIATVAGFARKTED